MKTKLIYFSFIIFLLFGCKSPEQKAKELIVKKVATITKNMESFEPISFSLLDSTFSDDLIYNNDSTFPKTFMGFNMTLKYRYLQSSTKREDVLIFYFDKEIKKINTVIRPLK